MSKLIAVDAGHGGQDPGACFASVFEKNIALLISKKLKAELLAQGFNVFVTREADTYDTPTRKAQKANSSGADIFISIHCNSAASETAKGTETLAFDTKGESGRLAEAIQKSLVSSLGLKDRGVKERKDLAVLNSTKMPAVLAEVAFISNEKERELLVSENFQEKAAKAICKGVCEHFNVKYKEDLEMVEQSQVKIDGKIYLVDRILKDGTNFIKVRDLEKAGFIIGNEGSMAVLSCPK